MKAYGKSWGYNVYDCRYCLYRKGKLKGCVYPDGTNDGCSECGYHGKVRRGMWVPHYVKGIQL